MDDRLILLKSTDSTLHRKRIFIRTYKKKKKKLLTRPYNFQSANKH